MPSKGLSELVIVIITVILMQNLPIIYFCFKIAERLLILETYQKIILKNLNIDFKNICNDK